jgi:phosphoglycolate phosphatase
MKGFATRREQVVVAERPNLDLACNPHYSPDKTLFSTRMTVFCDFDGPIINVSERYYCTYQLGLADTQALYQAEGIPLNLHLLSKEQFWQMKQDRVPDVEIALRSGLRGAQIDTFLQRVNQIVNQPTLLHKDQLQPGVRWALALLRAHGARLILVTLRCQEQVTQILEGYGLANLFTCICGTQDIHSAYQNSAELKAVLLGQLLKTPALWEFQKQPVWMMGDTEADILAGQSFGIPTIALTCGIRSGTYLQQHRPTHLFTDLLTAAHYLVGLTVNKQDGSEPIHIAQGV